MAEKRATEDDAVRLSALLQPDAGKRLEEQCVERWDVEAGPVDEGAMETTDAADLAFIVNGKAQRLGKRVVDAFTTRARIDQGEHALLGKVRCLARETARA